MIQQLGVWEHPPARRARLVVELVVEAIPGSGTCFESGAGGTTVFAGRGGETVQARRDLAAERIAACSALAARDAEPPWVFPDPAGAPCLWPRGEPLRIVARAATSNLSLTLKSAAGWFSASGMLEVDEGQTLEGCEARPRRPAHGEEGHPRARPHPRHSPPASTCAPRRATPTSSAATISSSRLNRCARRPDTASR